MHKKQNNVVNESGIREAKLFKAKEIVSRCPGCQKTDVACGAAASSPLSWGVLRWRRKSVLFSLHHDLTIDNRIRVVCYTCNVLGSPTRGIPEVRGG